LAKHVKTDAIEIQAKVGGGLMLSPSEHKAPEKPDYTAHIPSNYKSQEVNDLASTMQKVNADAINKYNQWYTEFQLFANSLGESVNLIAAGARPKNVMINLVTDAIVPPGQVTKFKASEIPFTPDQGILSVNVQDAIVEVKTDLDAISPLAHSALTLGSPSTGLSLAAGQILTITALYAIPLATDTAKGVTAYGWGNPSGVYLPIAATAADSTKWASYAFPTWAANSVLVTGASSGIQWNNAAAMKSLLNYYTSGDSPSFAALTISSGVLALSAATPNISGYAYFSGQMYVANNITTGTGITSPYLWLKNASLYSSKFYPAVAQGGDLEYTLPAAFQVGTFGVLTEGATGVMTWMTAAQLKTATGYLTDVQYSNMPDIAQYSIIGRSSAGAGVPQEITSDGTATKYLNGQLGFTVPATAAHNVLSATHGDALADSVLAGDIMIGNATPKWARLAKGTDNYVLTIDGATHLPTWKANTAGLPGLANTKIWIGDAGGAAQPFALSSDVTMTAGGAVTIAAGAITLAKMANLAGYSIMGNNGASAATPIALTYAQIKTALNSVPTVQKFTSSTGTYTTPAGVLYIKVRMVGGGGGGGGGGTGGGTGGTGGTSTFGTTLLSAVGGIGGTGAGAGGAGGTASLGTGPIGVALSGGSGGGGTFEALASIQYPCAGAGAASPFGGAGGGQNNAAGYAGITNTGSGGGGGSAGGGTSAYAAGGGGAGGYIEAIITSPGATYSYAVGAAGTAGATSTGGYAGGAGSSGIIIVEEYYQ
jgi:hypothetical protein